MLLYADYNCLFQLVKCGGIWINPFYYVQSTLSVLTVPSPVGSLKSLLCKIAVYLLVVQGLVSDSLQNLVFLIVHSTVNTSLYSITYLRV